MGDQPDRSPKAPFTEWAGAKSDSGEIREQGRLFRRRISIRHPDSVVGQHLAFTCFTDDGGFYFCKEDRFGHPAKATEWFATRLARHVGLPTAECAVIEVGAGEELFGSRLSGSIADRFKVVAFLTKTHSNELGGPGLWPGQFLAMLHAFDMFVDNPDRSPENFVLHREPAFTNLTAIDFASSRLLKFQTDHFPLESERTVLIRKIYSQIHGSHGDSANEMLDRLAAVPVSVVEEILAEMPPSWLSDDQRGKMREFWTEGGRESRLTLLRSMLSG